MELDFDIEDDFLFILCDLLVNVNGWWFEWLDEVCWCVGELGLRCDGLWILEWWLVEGSEVVFFEWSVVGFCWWIVLGLDEIVGVELVVVEWLSFVRFVGGSIFWLLFDIKDFCCVILNCGVDWVWVGLGGDVDMWNFFLGLVVGEIELEVDGFRKFNDWWVFLFFLCLELRLLDIVLVMFVILFSLLIRNFFFLFLFWGV